MVSLSAADEVDDLDLILGSDEGERPLRAADDVTIQLNGDAALGEREQSDHSREIGAVRHLALLTIEIERYLVHGSILAS